MSCWNGMPTLPTLQARQEKWGKGVTGLQTVGAPQLEQAWLSRSSRRHSSRSRLARLPGTTGRSPCWHFPQSHCRGWCSCENESETVFWWNEMGELLKNKKNTTSNNKMTPNSLADINAEISSDGSGVGLCWVGFTQHNPAGLHHTFAFPHLNTQTAFRRHQRLNTTVTPSNPGRWGEHRSSSSPTIGTLRPTFSGVNAEKRDLGDGRTSLHPANSRLIFDLSLIVTTFHARWCVYSWRSTAAQAAHVG